MPQLLTNLDNYPPQLRHGAVSVGNFDGVHRGHARLIGQLVTAARRLGGPAIVVTFDPPPAALLYPDRKLTPPLTTIRRRAELLFALGVDALVAYPTNHELLALSAEDFFRLKILGILEAKAMVEGSNFQFGRDREGDVFRLKALCESSAIEFVQADAVEDEAGMISSTRIRNLLNDGNLVHANSLLTLAYCIEGEVVPGARRGGELGFPTANLEGIESLVPGCGVYAGSVKTNAVKQRGDACYRAAINIGPNPTFGDNRAKVEVHIIDFDGAPLYGQRLSVSIFKKIRDVKKFESAQDLRLQIAKDVAACGLS